MHLTRDVRAGHRSAAPPDLLSGVAALIAGNGGSRLADSMALISCAERITGTHLLTAVNREPSNDR